MSANFLAVFGLLQLIYGVCMLFGGGATEEEIWRHLMSLPIERITWLCANITIGLWLIRIALAIRVMS